MARHVSRQGVPPPFEVNRVEQRIVVRDPAFGVFDGDRVVEVNVADGPETWTCWEVVTTNGERAVALGTRHGPASAQLLGVRPMPEWRGYPWDALEACRSAAEAKAWLGLDFPLPAHWDLAAWLGSVGDEEEPEDEVAPDALYEYGSWRTEAGPPRLVAIGELPDGTDAHFDYLATGLAAKLPPLDITGYELLAAATWTTTLYDPAGLDQDGGQGWHIVASVWWAGRQALLVGQWESMESVPCDPGEMTFRLLAPATPAEAEQVALGKIAAGVALPSFEWLYRKENGEAGRGAAERSRGQP